MNINTHGMEDDILRLQELAEKDEQTLVLRVDRIREEIDEKKLQGPDLEDYNEDLYHFQDQLALVRRLVRRLRSARETADEIGV